MDNEIFELDGEKYNNCLKKGYIARTKVDRRQWSTTDYTILFSKDRKYFWSPKYVDENGQLGQTISPEYGYGKFFHLRFTIDRF